MHRSSPLPRFLCAGTVVALLAGCGVSPSGSLAGSSTSTQADSSGSASAGCQTSGTQCWGKTFVYVGGFHIPASGSVTSSEIAGFRITPDGRAVPVRGADEILSGVGPGLAAAPSGNLLFADTSGPTAQSIGGTYSTYSVGANGSLSLAATTKQVANEPIFGTPPQWLGWISTDRTGGTLYGEQGSGGSNTGNQWIAEYAVGSTGSLSLFGAFESGLSSPISSAPDNQYGFYAVAGRGEGDLVPVRRNSAGTLSYDGNWQYPLYPPTSAGAPIASVPWYAMVSSNSDRVAVLYENSGARSGVMVYPIDSDGSAGVPTNYLSLSGTDSDDLWTLIGDSTGTYLFASDDLGNIYAIRFDSSANTLSLVGTTTTVAGPSASNPMSFLNGHLFAVHPGRADDPASYKLYIYNFSNGVLTPAPGSPVPVGFYAGDLAALQR